MEWPRTKTSDVAPPRATFFPEAAPPPEVEAAPPIDSVVDLSLSENRFEAALDAVASPNVDRAIATQVALEKLGQTARLDGMLRDALVRGVADPRTSSSRGAEGFLGKQQALAAAHVLLAMSDADYQRVKNLVESTGSPAERALILKAVAAKNDPSDIEVFAGKIAGVDRETLAEATSPLDLDGDRDPESHRQTYETSCAPASSQLVRAEADPIYALALKNGDRGAAEQKQVLEQTRSFGAVVETGVAVTREDAARVTEMAGALLAAARAGVTSKREDAALRKHATGGRLDAPERADFQAGLRKLREVTGGFPSDRELSAIRGARGLIGEGMRAEPALEEIATPATGLAYREHAFARGSAEAIEARLRDGQDVTIAIAGRATNDAHFLVMSDVRGSGGNADYLVSDTVSGKTEWVRARDLANGSFPGKQLDLPNFDRISSWYRER
jgi:hypothetical protein